MDQLGGTLIAYTMTPRTKQEMGLARPTKARSERARLRPGARIHGASLEGSGTAGPRRHRAAGPSFAFVALSRSLGTTIVD